MMMRALRHTKRGFTLIELMIVVVIVGILAALAIYGVSRYMRNSKTAEARNSIGQMSKDASTAYQRESMAASVLALGASTGVVNALCASATATVPASLAGIQGQKFQSSPSDWNAGNQTTGWQCLKFSMDAPQYYMYNYTAAAPLNDTGGTFTASATGDLDNDGVTSTFAQTGTIAAQANEKVLVIAPSIAETNPEE